MRRSLLVLFASVAVSALGQSPNVIKFAELKRVLDRSDDTLRVVNFWATWCAPCIRELPHFEALQQANTNRNVRVLLVSVDDKADLTTKVIPFLRRRHIRSRVVLLDEPDLNTWVDQVAPEWSGALPMTLIVNKKQNRRQFIGKPVKAGELDLLINTNKP